jgi:hypothetical protein
MKLLPLLLTTAMLCACAPMVWVRPDTTPEQAKSDGAECQISAYGKYPEKEVVITPGDKREPSTFQDSNDTLRDAEAAYCMRMQGYTWQRAK